MMLMMMGLGGAERGRKGSGWCLNWKLGDLECEDPRVFGVHTLSTCCVHGSGRDSLYYVIDIILTL